ncbi:response regulator transcription factor [Pseudoxanthobacter sp.]|uniref:response regulator transcription factor n=1 Tax=Pseudoxanthobacter sp. TaxID=1925742 RepID=UPI002FDF9C25
MSATPRHRFVIVDDHPLFRGALRQVLEGLDDDVVVDEAGSLDEVVALLDRIDDIDLLLLDLTMPGVQGFSGLLYLRAQYPAVPVVVVSATEEPATIRRAMEFGAAGFIPKSLGSIEAIRAAVGAVLAGGEWVPPDSVGTDEGENDEDIVRRLATLTPQQLRVLMMLSEGLLNKQIAHALGVSEATVKAHVSAVLQKLGVESRTQAVIAAGRIAGAPRAGAPT